MWIRRTFLMRLLPAAVVLRPGKGRAASVRTHSYRGVRYVSLPALAALYSMTLSRNDREKISRMNNRWHRLEFEHNSRKIRINGMLIWLHRPVLSLHGDWAVTEKDFLTGIDPVLRPEYYLRRLQCRTVVLDPGHGGHDKGAIGQRNVLEKLVVMDVARRTEKHLKAAGVNVRKTRDSDEFIPLKERAARAARMKADLFVSIHVNGTVSTSVHGTETYVLTAEGEESANSYGSGKGSRAALKGNRFDAANMLLGVELQKALLASCNRADRGVKRARFSVLAEAPCPAALVECAFVTHPEEEDKMIKASFREAMALGISNGILATLSRIRAAS